MSEPSTGPRAAGRSTAGAPIPVSRGRRVLSLTASVALLAAAGTLVAVPALTPGAAPAANARTVPAPAVAVPAAGTTTVCPGAPRLLTVGAGGDPRFSPVSASARTTVAAVVRSTSTGLIGGTALEPLAGGDPVATVARPIPTTAAPGGLRVAARTGVGVSVPTVLRAAPAGQAPTAAAAALGYRADDGDLRGLAAASCQRPGNDLWLLGASTTGGRTAILTVHNPGTSPATVRLDLAGGGGPITATGGRELLVGAGASRSVVLAGLAPGEAELGVRVRSRGAPVAAVIQQSVLRGLTPGGVEYLTPVPGPALSRTVPGVLLQSPAATAALRRTAPDAVPVLQLAVPGDAEATVRVQAQGPAGAVTIGSAGIVRARAGAVTTVDLGALPAGTWGLTVRSDVAITAGVRTVRGDSARRPVDIAEAGAADRLGQDVVLPVVPVGTPRLALTAPGEAATVTIRPVTGNGGFGPARTVRVGAGRTVVTDPRQGASNPAAVRLQSDGGAVYAAQITTAGATGIAVAAVPEPDDDVRRISLRIVP